MDFHIPARTVEHHYMAFFIAACMASLVAQTHGNSESFKAEYFTNVSLPCNFTRHELSYPNLQVPLKRYWLLPNATIIDDTMLPGTGRYTVIKPITNPSEFWLHIQGVDDPDFGVYHCIMIWNNWDYKMDAIRVGLNEDGPYYQKKLEQFERNVLIGSAAAGGVVLICLIICIVCICRRRMKSKNKPDFDMFVTDPNGHDHHSRGYNYEINVAGPGAGAGTPAPDKPEGTSGDIYAKVIKKTSGGQSGSQSAKL